MAEIVVTAVLTALCEKLFSSDLMKLARTQGIDPHLNKWKKTLPLIQAVLADAGQKQITERAVQLWLNDLQDLAYDIDDVLDDLATEVARRKLIQQTQASSTNTSMVMKFIPTCCTNFTPSNIMYGREMSSRLNAITTKLNDLVDEKNGIGLHVNVNFERPNQSERRLEQTSLVDESKIMGREGDKEALLEKLLANNENVCIVSIVGMGGIGKTSLAKILYNEEKVKNHFELRAWVCVSEECDVFNTSNTIFQAVGGEDKRFSNLDMLHVALKEKLLKKRFLIVLDDVWNVDRSKWELLQSPLLGGSPGSKVMVTTRDTRVASVMDSDEAYHLEVLSNEVALSLFSQHALGEKNFDKHPTLKFYGEGMVKKCGRLPLALKTLGRVLKTNRNGYEWEKLLNSEIWDIDDGGEILPALRLSYCHLPPHLKRLFAYCSLFPKDYVFEKKELVLLWMAEGFLSQSKGTKSMESLGYQYFEELKSRSFFQHSTDEELGYTMHDLINNLATSVAGEFFFRLDDEMDASDRNETFETFRHLSLVGPRCGSFRKLKDLQRATRLHTFLLMLVGWKTNGLLDRVLVELLPELQFLRVLSLSTQRVIEVPKCIGSLKHLRYLNFSYTEIICLPEQVSDLYNLESLLVQGCYELSGLPEGFVKLINLRHLDITDTPKLKKMPFGIGGLTSLQTLPKVIITTGATGFRISELKGLSDLQGGLSIMGLEKVINPIQAKDANLHQKKGLDVLEMKWSDVFDDSRNEKIEYEVLAELRPSHHKLRNLKILFYKGTRFPSWVSDPSFDQLTEITLRGCRSTHVPTLGHLRSLRKLFVEKMNEVKTLGFELLAPTNSLVGIAFPSLEVLEFDDMQGWQTWATSCADNNEIARSFPCLRYISIKHCPRLVEVSIGLIPSLRVLHIEHCFEAVLRSMVCVSSSLVVLQMLNVKGLTHVHTEDLMHLGKLENLYIDKCDELKYLWERDSDACKILVSLQKLEVRNCKKLVSLGEKDVNLGINMISVKQVIFHNCDTLESYNCPNSVESLEISSCDSITSLTFSAMQEQPSVVTESIISDCDNIKPIPNIGSGYHPLFRLISLQIYNCKNLKSFLHEHLQRLTCLEQLWIYDCPSMDYSFPCGLWPPNLNTLNIGGLKKAMSEWGTQNYPTSLVDLYLNGKNSGVVSFALEEDARNTTTSSSFLLPSSIVSLTLSGFKDVESFLAVSRQLPCLEHLNIWFCPKLRDLPYITSDPVFLKVRVG